jgi:outer membrane lipoprotein SlyB
MKKCSGGRALMATDGAGAVAKGLIGEAHHQAIGRADGVEVMQAHDDFCRRKMPADEGQNIDPETDEVMDVDDIRVDVPEEGDEGLGQRNVRIL